VFISVPEGGLSPRWLGERSQTAVGGGAREGVAVRRLDHGRRWWCSGGSRLGLWL